MRAAVCERVCFYVCMCKQTRAFKNAARLCVLERGGWKTITLNVLTVVAVWSGVAGSTRTRVAVDTVVTRSAILTRIRTAVVNVCQIHEQYVK